MKRKLMICLIMILSFNLFANEKYEQKKYFYTRDRLKVRESSNLNSNVITVLDKGSCVLLLEEGPEENIDYFSDNWVRVKSLHLEKSTDKTIEGWVYGGYLEEVTFVNEFCDDNAICFIVKTSEERNKYGEDIYNSFYFLDKDSNLHKSVTIKDEYDGPNYQKVNYLYYRIENNKKVIYLGIQTGDDFYSSHCINRIIIDDDYQNTNSTKLLYSYKYFEDNSKNERFPIKMFNMYKKRDTSSEVIDSIQENEMFEFDTGYEYKLEFDENKPGVWVKAGKLSSSRRDYNWIWVE